MKLDKIRTLEKDVVMSGSMLAGRSRAIEPDFQSNVQARKTWEQKAVGSQRSAAHKGSRQYFEDIRNYRYGYETPFIPRVFGFKQLSGKSVLEIGVGNGIDAIEMVRHGAVYSGLDITQNHLELTRQNFAMNLPDYDPQLIHGDLLEVDLERQFDVIYSFGVLHHIAHEEPYLGKLRTLLRHDGRLKIAVYSKWSFFNAVMFAKWLLRNDISLHDWRSHFAEGSPLGEPVTIKIRSRRQVEKVLRSSGFDVVRYNKCGFVQKYIPCLGQFLSVDGITLRSLGAMLGWYHVFECR